VRSFSPALPASRRVRRIARTGVLGAAAAAAALTTTVACTAPQGDLADQLGRLRMCESSGNYAINTGNGFYGAYQFDLGTWRGLGYSGYPNQAAPFVQDAAATTLHAQRGWAPWPGCSAKLGLR
jgi:hypothetical protein